MGQVKYEYSHLHLYVAVETSLNENAKAFIKPFTPFKTKSVEENNAREVEHYQKEEKKLSERLDAIRVSKVVAEAYLFTSQERRSEYAVPAARDPGTVSKRLVIDGVQSATNFFLAVTKLIENTKKTVSPDLSPDGVSFRSKDGSWARHALRVSAIGETPNGLFQSGISPALYLAQQTYSWTSVLGPKADIDQERFVDRLVEKYQLKLAGSPAEQELNKTLLLYRLAGLLA